MSLFGLPRRRRIIGHWRSRLLGIRPEDVDLAVAAGPAGKRCHMFNGVCTGKCAGTPVCRRAAFRRA